MWTDGRASARTAGASVAVPPALAIRLKAVDRNSVEGHPYLVHRLAQVYAGARLPAPSWLTTATRGLATLALPSPTTTESVLDAAAIAQQRA